MDGVGGRGDISTKLIPIEIDNIDGENVQIYWMTWVISMKFSGKIWLMIILKVTKKIVSPSV